MQILGGRRVAIFCTNCRIAAVLFCGCPNLRINMSNVNGSIYMFCIVSDELKNLFRESVPSVVEWRDTCWINCVIIHMFLMSLHCEAAARVTCHTPASQMGSRQQFNDNNAAVEQLTSVAMLSGLADGRLLQRHEWTQWTQHGTNWITVDV